MKTNMILHGDCRNRLSEIPTESVDLIYLDPPFFSNKEYESQMNDGTEKMKASFDDRWAGGIEKFIEWMRPALSECHRILKNTGSIYLHCDWHADSELDVLMKEIFGRENKRNAIAWCYSSMGRAKKQFKRKHDTILFYSKDIKQNLFNLEKVPNKNGTFYHYNGDDPWNKSGKVFEHKEKALEDFWTDIPPTYQSFQKKEMTYPTQKPEKLLDRIIKASSNEGDLVLDPFMGSGTTLAVAAKLGRQFIGIDHSERACEISKKRLGGIEVLEGQGIEVSYKHESIGYLKNMFAFDFERWACERLGGRHIGRTRNKDGEMKDGTPIEVKTWKESEKVGRSVVEKLAGVAVLSTTKKGILVGWDFTKEATMKAIELEKAGIEIELVKVEDLRKQ